MTTYRRNNLIREVEELVRVLQQRPTADVDAVLAELTAGAVRAMPPARHAGITLAKPGDVHTASATGRIPVLLDEIQQRHNEGPCLSAAWQQQMIRIDDMVLETRWPAYSRDAVEQTAVRSVICFELFTQTPRMGVLSFYAEQPNAFDEEAVEVGLIYAAHTALVWSLVRREGQFRSALASRDIIGQAKGVIMERFKIDALQAFELLRRLSQTGNMPLAVVAEKLSNGERLGDSLGPP